MATDTKIQDIALDYILRAKLKSRRDDLIIAQGKRGTSAALGCVPKMIDGGTLRAILRQTGLGIDEFKQLL
jgi:hypothetical protein